MHCELCTIFAKGAVSLTIQDIFDEVDTLVPNFYSSSQKLRWFNDLEYKIYKEIFTEFYPGELPDYADHADASETPLLDDAYGRDMYLHYLVAQIDFYNDEYSKYNQAITLFNNAYKAFEDYYTRTYSSNREHGWRI